MQIELVSDLHIDALTTEARLSLADRIIHSYASLVPANERVLIVAGDLSEFSTLAKVSNTRGFLSYLSSHFDQLIYIPGNHEYYDLTYKEATNKLLDVSMGIDNLEIITSPKEALLPDGVTKIACATGWYAYHDSIPELLRYKRIGDYSIKDLDWVYEENKKAAQLFSTTDATIWAMHHLPAVECIAPRFVNSVLNPFFVTGFDNIVTEKRPHLVMYGHTHDRSEATYSVNVGTTLVTNPFGYPGEAAGQLNYTSKIVYTT